MNRFFGGLALAVVGVMAARLGQGVMAVRWDPMWAAVGVCSILGGAALTMAPHIHRALAPVTARARNTSRH